MSSNSRDGPARCDRWRVSESCNALRRQGSRLGFPPGISLACCRLYGSRNAGRRSRRVLCTLKRLALSARRRLPSVPVWASFSKRLGAPRLPWKVLLRFTVRSSIMGTSQRNSASSGKVPAERPEGIVVTTQTKPAAGRNSAETQSQEPRMNRWLTILYIIICFEMGAFLFLFPWMPLWSQNFFMSHYPWISTLARNYYVRGAISGLGLVDVFLAFYEVWRLRRVIGLVH